MPKVILKNFSGQISTDTRSTSLADCKYSENFDTTGRNDVLYPMKGTASMTATNFFLNDFVYGNFGTGISENVLAYGVQSGQATGGRPELYKISDALPGTTFATALTATGTSLDDRLTPSASVFNNLFHYHRDFLYLATGVGPSSGAYINKIGNLKTAGQGATWTPRWLSSLSFNSVTQAITHSKDGIMYFVINDSISSPSSSTVVKITNDTTSNTAAFVLPIGYSCTSVCEYGDMIAFALKSNDKGASKVVFWNRDTSQTLLTETIDWGQGDLNVLENIDGHLIGVSLVYNASFNLNPRVVVKEYAGGTVNIINTIYISSATVPILSTKKFKQNNSLYFALKATISGTNHTIFTVAKNKDGRFIVTGDTAVNNNNSVATIEGFAKVGDVWFIGFDAGSVNRTRTASGYGAYGIWNSLKNHGIPLSDRPSLKQLVAVQLNYDAIPSGGSVTVSYTIDEASAINVISSSTVGSTSQTMTIDVNGNEFTSGYDYEFEIRSTGAIVTGLVYIYRVLSTNIELNG